jgi:hypothetical protein
MSPSEPHHPHAGSLDGQAPSEMEKIKQRKRYASHYEPIAWDSAFQLIAAN